MGSSSGLIIAFVVVVWAAYFIPLALRRYDEASKNASVETTGGLSRVISRKGTQKAAAAQPAPVVQAASTPGQSTTAQTAKATTKGPTRSVDRPAARLAARRRRRTLLTLLAATAIVGGLAGFGVIAPYYVAAPVALVVAWLVACRIQVRGERGLARPRVTRTAPAAKIAAKQPQDAETRAEKPQVKAKKPKVDKPGSKARAAKLRATLGRVTAPTPKSARPSPAKAADEEDTIVVSGQFEDIDPGRKHEMENVPLEVDALDDQIVIAVPSISTAGEALWDPLPVTLPTYVTKPRAGRTVRTIDFSQPHTWTSGHIEGEDVELPKRDDDTGEERRAVGH